MKTLADVKAGDEVVMVYRTRYRNSENLALRGIVTAAKRVNLTVTEKRLDDLRPRIWRARRDGTMVDHEWWIYTVEEHEHNERRRAARDILHRHGIDIRRDSPWDDREIELAGLLDEYIVERHSFANIMNNLRKAGR